MSARGQEYFHFDPFLFGDRVSKRCKYVYLDTYISGCLCGLNTSRLHKSNCTIYIDLVVWNMNGC